MIRVLGVPRHSVGSGHSAEPEPCFTVSAVPASVPNAGITVEDITPSLFRAFTTRMTVAQIQHTVAEFYGVRTFYMTAPDGVGMRERRVARPRWVAMALSRELTSMTLPEIGRRFGGRDHSTVIHAIRRVEELTLRDPCVALEVEILRERLSQPESIAA